MTRRAIICISSHKLQQRHEGACGEHTLCRSAQIIMRGQLYIKLCVVNLPWKAKDRAKMYMKISHMSSSECVGSSLSRGSLTV